MVATLAVDQEKLARIKRSVGDDYVPSDDEEYMGEQQLDYFRMLLLEWKKSIHDAAENTLQSLQDGPLREADLNDRASSETDWGIELRTRDRQRKLSAKIDSALRRIDAGERAVLFNCATGLKYPMPDAGVTIDQAIPVDYEAMCAGAQR